MAHSSFNMFRWNINIFSGPTIRTKVGHSQVDLSSLIFVSNSKLFRARSNGTRCERTEQKYYRPTESRSKPTGPLENSESDMPKTDIGEPSLGIKWSRSDREAPIPRSIHQKSAIGELRPGIRRPRSDREVTDGEKWIQGFRIWFVHFTPLHRAVIVSNCIISLRRCMQRNTTLLGQVPSWST